MVEKQIRRLLQENSLRPSSLQYSTRYCSYERVLSSETLCTSTTSSTYCVLRAIVSAILDPSWILGHPLKARLRER
jgi:hypothetical protein